MAPGSANPLEPGRDIHPVAHEIAVALLHHVAEMDADAELDPSVLGDACVAFDRSFLHFDRAAHGVDHASELDDAAVAGALDDAPAMQSDGGIDEIAP